MSHDAVPDSATDALPHDGSPGADALWRRVVVLLSLVRDDPRLRVGTRWADGTSRRD